MPENAQPTDGFALFSDRSVVAMRVNGILKDLATTVTDADALPFLSSFPSFSLSSILSPFTI